MYKNDFIYGWSNKQAFAINLEVGILNWLNPYLDSVIVTVSDVRKSFRLGFRLL